MKGHILPGILLLLMVTDAQALENVVLLPHIGSASIQTRAAMGQLVVDNLTAWFAQGQPLTPVAECRGILERP